MKISAFKVDQFAKDEYTSEQKPQYQGLNGEDLLITGPNRSGKSLTFNAILYSILGHKATINTKSGKGNSVSLTLSDGSKMFRGDPVRKFEGEDIFKKDSADTKLHSKIGDSDIIYSHFIHSHLNELPLEDLDKKARLNQILSVIDLDSKERAEEIEEDLEQLEDELVDQEDRISPLKRREKKLQYQVNKFERQYEDWNKVNELCEDGALKVIEAELEERSKIREKLEDLSERRRGVTRKITSKKKEADELERYENDVDELIIEALKEFVCPVCDDRVDSDTARRRLDNRCPYCGMDHSIQELKRSLREKKSENEGKPAELRNEVENLVDERDEIDKKIAELESEVPEIAEVNDLAVDLLRREDSIEEIREKSREELKNSEESLHSAQDTLGDVREQLAKRETRVDEIKDEQKDKKAELEKLREGRHYGKIEQFAKIWSDHFDGIAGDLRLTIDIDPESGDISLPGSDSSRRYYDRRGDLSDSELRLLNISYAISLNEVANDSGVINWETLVLDEPFSHLDPSTKDNALNYLRSLKQQVILTTSDNYIRENFTDNKVELERKSLQTSLKREDWDNE